MRAACSDDDPATTTTRPPRRAEPSAIALRGDGLGVVALGAAPDAAIAAVSAELGEPSVDTGWEPSFSTYGTCPGEQIRGVEWDGLVLLFTDGDTAEGTGEHLFTWRVTGAPPAVSTAMGLGFGATAADAEDLYPGEVETVPAEDRSRRSSRSRPRAASSGPSSTTRTRSPTSRPAPPAASSRRGQAAPLLGTRGPWTSFATLMAPSSYP